MQYGYLLERIDGVIKSAYPFQLHFQPPPPALRSAASTMSSTLRLFPRVTSRALRSRSQIPFLTQASRTFSALPRLHTRGPPAPPDAESAALHNGSTPSYLGTTKLLPEFNLVGKVVLVSGAARGLGLVQAEALLEAGATGTPPISSPSPASKLCSLIDIIKSTHSTASKPPPQTSPAFKSAQKRNSEPRSPTTGSTSAMSTN